MNTYGRMRFPVYSDKRSKIFRAHRVAYMAWHELFPEHVPEKSDTGEQLDVSHLCHRKRCIQEKHLVLERHSTNNQRKICDGQGWCSGAHQPACIL
ncbi:MAG: hypothetical protein ABW168_19560 [Sedimenticola sp.]